MAGTALITAFGLATVGPTASAANDPHPQPSHTIKSDPGPNQKVTRNDTPGSAGAVPDVKASKTFKRSPSGFLKLSARPSLTGTQGLLATVGHTFTVNDLGDTADATPGDNICADAGGKCTLRAAVDEANSDADTDAINVPAGTITLSLGEIDVSNPVLISGAGMGSTTVDAATLSRAFSLDAGGNVSFTGFAVKNGAVAADGAGVYVTANTVFSADHMLFAGNDNFASSSSGGAIYSEWDSSVWISASTFTGNHSYYGGAAYFAGPSQVVNSTFGGSAAGAGNTADEGGALYVDDSGRIEGSTFQNNAGESSAGAEDGYGGAVYASYPLEISGGSFVGNVAYEGGAVYADGDYLLVADASLVSNRATDGYGGGIYNVYTLDLRDSHVDGNFAGYEGGAVYNDGTLAMVGGTMSGNVVGVTADDNYVYGGALSNEGSFATLNGVVMDGNQAHAGATTYAEGAAIYSDEYLGLTDVTITNSLADGYGFYGGAIEADYGLNAHNVSIANTTVNVTDGGEGGALYYDDDSVLNDVSLSGTKVTITSPTADNGWLYGGAMYTGDYGVLDNVQVKDTTVTGTNMSYVYGSVVYSSYPGVWRHVTLGKSLTTVDSYVEGVFWEDDDWTGDAVSIVNNKIVLTAANSSASYGGMYGYYDTSMTNVTISGNSLTAPADYTGQLVGGAYLYDDDYMLTNITIANNTVTGGSNAGNIGGVLADGYNAMFKNSIIANNTGAQCGAVNGGAVISAGYNLSSDATCGFTQPNDMSSVNPLLGSVADNGGLVPTQALLPGSPAIDSGTSSGAPKTDARGVARPQGSAVDRGAFELRPAQQPDLMIHKANAKWKGNNIYNTTAKGQKVSTKAHRTDVRTFWIRVYNDGNQSATFTVKGSNAKKISVKYFSGGKNITSSMKSASGLSFTLAPGGYKKIKVQVTVGHHAAFGSHKYVLVTGTSAIDGVVKTDAVKGVVNVKK